MDTRRYEPTELANRNDWDSCYKCYSSYSMHMSAVESHKVVYMELRSTG